MDEFQKLNQLFNLNTIPFEEKKEKAIIVPEDNSPDADFNLARKTIIETISKNSDALDNILKIASTAESSRAFEVAGQLVKAQTELARELMNAHKQKKDIDGGVANNNIKQQNNIVFAGSTSELMKMISAEKAKLIEPES